MICSITVEQQFSISMVYMCEFNATNLGMKEKLEMISLQGKRFLYTAFGVLNETYTNIFTLHS